MADAIRLQKILSQWGIASRRHAEALILSGQVTLNGKVATLGDKADPNVDQIEVQGQPVQPQARPQFIYLLLHKPAGVITTCTDPQGRLTVMDLLPPDYRQSQGLHPVGRLDNDTTGALLITNDGELTHGLTHPRHLVAKTYQAWVRGHLDLTALERWRQGVDLAGQMTWPAEVHILKRLQNPQATTLLKIVLKEGRNRQIRRVADLLGYPVLQLHRTGIAGLWLNSTQAGGLSNRGSANLPQGEYRHLTDQEVKNLKQLVYQVSSHNVEGR
jgi:pseudouridine synthase